MRNDILVLGGPGSGKDTQAEKISEEYGIPKLDAGETLRKHGDVVLQYAPEDPERHGQYVEYRDGPMTIDDLVDGPEALPDAYRTIHQWLPDPPHAETTAYLTGRELEENPEYADGVVFSGYPRTLEQAELMTDMPIEPSVIFVLDVSTDEAIRRLSGRGREDDTPNEILDRQTWQYAQLNRIQAYYREEDSTYANRIEWIWPETADKDEDTVFDAIEDVMDKEYSGDTR